MEHRKHFVLVHGAWHGGWAWDGVIAALEAAGHTATAPDMPGRDDGRATVTLDDYVDAVVRAVERAGGPVILVGHSSAGFLMQAAAPRVEQKLEALVFHNAFLLPDDTAQLELIPPDLGAGMRAAADASPDQSVPVMEEFVRGVLMAGDDASAQDAVIARLNPEPVSLFSTKVQTRAFSDLRVPKRVLFARDDVSMPPGTYLGMATQAGITDVTEIPGGHEALFIDPAGVARGLISLSA